MQTFLFSDFSLKATTLSRLEQLGFSTPTPIQVLSIPEILQGFDVLAQAQTGTGKTAAFALPTLNKVNELGLQVMVLAPTRELAQQVGDEFLRLGQNQNLKVAVVVGGNSYRLQLEALKKAQVLIATPGRLHDLLSSNRLKLDQVHTVILDEADRMLDMGFSKDLEAIMTYLPASRQTLCFSATFPESIRRLAQKILKTDHKKIKVQNNSDTNQDVEQLYSVVRNDEKDEAICRWIDYNDPIKTIVFCEMKKDADRLATALTQKGYSALVLHGDTEQRRREFVMQQFKTKKKALLIATDIAARGLDVSDVSHVVNYQIPSQVESYVHRIGRTGRAGKKGVAFSLVTPGEVRYFLRWADRTKSQLVKIEIPKLSDLKKKMIQQLFDDLLKVDLQTDILMTITEWSENHALHELTAALVQKHLQQKNIQGPEFIGVKESDLRPIRPPQVQRGASRSGGGAAWASKRTSSGSNGGRGQYGRAGAGSSSSGSRTSTGRRNDQSSERGSSSGGTLGGSRGGPRHQQKNSRSRVESGY